MQRKVIAIGVVACVLALVIGGLCIAQPPAGGNRQGGQGGPGGRGQFDPAQMRQRMMDNFKQQLGADDEAWKVMEPRLMKVMDLNRQVSAGGGRGMFGGMRPQRGGNQGGPGGDRGGQQADRRGPMGQQGELSAVEKAMQQLGTTLENQSASPEEIKKQLTAVRSAREKARQDLAAARQSLKEICTVRQEAMFVTMGMLE